MRIHLDFDVDRSSGVVGFAAHGDHARQVNGHVWQAGGVFRALTTGNTGRGQHADRLKAIEAAVADAGLPVGLRGGVGGVH